MASPFGGVNIEEIAKTSPSHIYKDGVDITTGNEILGTLHDESHNVMGYL